MGFVQEGTVVVEGLDGLPPRQDPNARQLHAVAVVVEALVLGSDIGTLRKLLWAVFWVNLLLIVPARCALEVRGYLRRAPGEQETAAWLRMWSSGRPRFLCGSHGRVAQL